VIDRQVQQGGAVEDYAWDSFSKQLDPFEQAVRNEEIDNYPPELVAEITEAVRGYERVETTRTILNHLLRDFRRTPSAEDVGKRVLAMGKMIGHRELENLSLSDIGAACGETKAAVSARIRRECNTPIEASGGVAQARFQQSPAQRAKSAEVQRGNTNRRNGNGKGSQ